MFFFRVPVKQQRVLIKTASLITEIDQRITKIRQTNFDTSGIELLKIDSLTRLKNELASATALSPTAAARKINEWQKASAIFHGNKIFTNADLAKFHRRQSQGYGIFSSIYNAVSGLFATDTDKMIKRMLAKTRRPAIENKIDPKYIHTFSKL